MSNINTEKDFWQRVNKTATCWLREGAAAGSGYNILQWNGKLIYAHRLSWIIHYGYIPDKMMVLHKCDQPRCIRPSHLFIGTQLDNIRDMIKKGRRGYTGLPGEKHPDHKLTLKQVKEIRAKYATNKYTQQQLANKYGVRQCNITKIVNFNIWKNE